MHVGACPYVFIYNRYNLLTMNLLKTSLITLSLLAATGANAENYPYRDDMLWVTTPDHADWLYETGENAVIDIQLYRYGIPVDTIARSAMTKCLQTHPELFLSRMVKGCLISAH